MPTTLSDVARAADACTRMHANATCPQVAQ